MLSGCAAGVVPPSAKLKVREVGEAVRAGAVTVKLTLTTCDVSPADATVTVPVKEPAARPDVLMETLTDPGVGLVATADSHDPPDLVAAVAVKTSPEVPPTLNDCEVGAGAPSV